MDLAIILNFITIDYVWISIGAIFVILGLIGCLHPVIPGPPLSYVGVLMLQLLSTKHLPTLYMIILAILAILAMFLDFFVPILKTRRIGTFKISMIARLLVSLYLTYEFISVIVCNV